MYIVVIVCIVVLLILLSGVFMSFGDSGYEVKHVILGLLGVACGVIAGVILISSAITSFKWFAAGTKVNVINREYGTHYTQAEMFYASDVIDMVRQLDRNRYDITVRNPDGKQGVTK